MRIIGLFVGAVVALSIAGCGKTGSDKAMQLLDKAQVEYEKGECDSALSTLSLIDSLYPREFDVRRQAQHFRPKIIEKQTLALLTETDSLLALCKWRGDSLGSLLKRVGNSIENYYVAAGDPVEINSRPGVYARMSPDAVFYITAITNGVSADALQVAVNGAVASTSVLPHDGERVCRNGANYAMTFLQAECDSLARLISSVDGPVAVTFLNNSRPVSKVNLSADDVKRFALVYRNAESVVQTKLLNIRKEQLEKTLTVARSQIARTTNSTPVADK